MLTLSRFYSNARFVAVPFAADVLFSEYTQIKRETKKSSVIRRTFLIPRKARTLLNDWITFFENYRCDKALLEQYRFELKRLMNAGKGGFSDPIEISAVTAGLEESVEAAEGALRRYIPKDARIREIPKYAEEKMFLTFRYIYGMTMQQTAAAMNVSRDTVYRIRRRILSRPFPQSSPSG